MQVALFIDDKILLTPEEFRTLVIVRAGYRCQNCYKTIEQLKQIDYERLGKSLKRRVLQAHHKDRDKENNTLLNGICLCTTCHNKEHEEEKNEGLRQRNLNGQASEAGKLAWEKINSMSEDDRQKYLSDRSKKAWETRRARYGFKGVKS